MDEETYYKVAGGMWWALKVTGNTEMKNGVLNFVK